MVRFVLAAALLAGALGCGTRAATVDHAAVGRAAAPERFEPTLASEGGRYLIRSAAISVAVGEVSAAVRQVEDLVRAEGGYVESSSRSDEAASLTARVPWQRLDATLDRVAALGDEKERSTSTSDVTEQLVDLEARLANARTLRDRLKDLLAKAKSVKDLLEVEKELARVQAEVDSMQGRLDHLKGQVALSRLDVTLTQRRILGPLGLAIEGIGWVIERLFVLRP